MFTSYTKLEIRQFQVVVGNGTHLLKTSNFIAVVVQLRQRKVQKKRDARAKLLFCESTLIAFLPFSLPSPSSLLKLPNSRLREVVVSESRTSQDLSPT